jgi:hypothetical protein
MKKQIVVSRRVKAMAKRAIAISARRPERMAHALEYVADLQSILKQVDTLTNSEWEDDILDALGFSLDTMERGLDSLDNSD